MSLESRSAAVTRLKQRLALLEAREIRERRREAQEPWRDLAEGALQEIIPRDWRDSAAAFGYAFALAGRFAKNRDGAVVVISMRRDERELGRFYAPKNSVSGLPAARLVFCTVDDMRSLLWAGEEATRSGAVAATILDAGKPHSLLNLTATRRLQLSAEASGATPILLRSYSDDEHSAAHRRYRLSSEKSAGAPDDHLSPGRAKWRVAIDRCRAGACGEWVVEWDEEQGDLREAAPFHVPFPAAIADRSSGLRESAA